MRSAQRDVGMKAILQKLQVFHGASNYYPAHGMADEAEPIRLFDSLKVLLDFDGQPNSCLFDAIVRFIDIGAADINLCLETRLQTQLELDEVVSMRLITMNHKNNMLVPFRDLMIDWVVSCLVDFFEDFDRVLEIREEVEVLDGEGSAPILLVAFSHEGYLFKVIFGVFSIFIEGPVVVLDPLAEEVGFQALFDLFFMFFLQSCHDFPRVVLDEPIELVPVGIDQGLKVEDIFQECFTEPYLIFFLDCWAILESLNDSKQLSVLAHFRVGRLLGMIQHHLTVLVDSFLDTAQLRLQSFPVLMIKIDELVVPIQHIAGSTINCLSCEVFLEGRILLFQKLRLILILFEFVFHECRMIRS